MARTEREIGAAVEERKREDSASVDIDAPATAVYALVSDISLMGDWSPECRRCEWIGGATGPAIGARFKARNQAEHGPAWSNKPTVVVAEQGKEFSFTRKGVGIGEVVWRYRMHEIEGKTRLTESYEVIEPAAKPILWLTTKLTRIEDRTTDLQQNMRTTLANIKAAAEHSR